MGGVGWVTFQGFLVREACFGVLVGGAGILWYSQDLDLSLLPLVFSLILTVASRFLHLYSTNDKTSRLIMKSFSTVRDTQKDAQSYMEKRRGRREIEVTRRRRGGIKKGESKLDSKHFPMCSPQSGPLRDIHGVTQRREEGGRRQRWPGGQKGESKGERQIQPVISSLSVLHSPEQIKIVTELGREEKGEGGDRGDMVEKKESPKWERELSSQ